MPEQPRPRVPAQPVGGLVERLPGARLHGDPAVAVTGITHDSRHVQRGDLYLARAGERAHGISFLTDALTAGAVAVLTDPASVGSAVAAGTGAVVEVPDPRAVTGPAAAWVYGDPSHDLVVIGVTGTNGKTTTAYLVEAGLRAAGRRTGLIGTIESVVAGTAMPSLRTTPEATDLQALFAVMRERSVTDVAMEVSSHALALDRVDGTVFAVAGFTNLSQDHLDFHADMDDYFAAKARLFTPELSRRGVVAVDVVSETRNVDVVSERRNVDVVSETRKGDNDWGRRLAREAGVPVTTIGRVDADWVLGETTMTDVGGSVVVRGPDGGEHRIDVQLPGRFNLDNAALAFVVLVEAGVDAADAARGIAELTTVPGRMERVDAGQPFTVLVDYAHTPAAVGELLAEARTMVASGGRVVVVLGCGGDRDAGKRPLMGAAAAAGADLAVLTSDNPRSEDPQAILDAMLTGARGVPESGELLVEPDRRVAISRAVAAAGPGDVVVVAGKGHEQGQEQDGVVLPFDDRQVVRDALAAHGHSRAGVRPA